MVVGNGVCEVQVTKKRGHVLSAQKCRGFVYVITLGFPGGHANNKRKKEKENLSEDLYGTLTTSALV